MTAPKTPKDLALAPVAVQVDQNLRRLRDLTPTQIDYEIALELDKPAIPNTPEMRAERVLQVALRDVEMHGWHAEITPDYSAVRLSGGSVSLDISTGATVPEFIADPVAV
ncbi:MAG: hypothetical protein R2736_15615 [Solirubrobacterales bacterium]